jgi:cytoskeletal protein RodZ
MPALGERFRAAREARGLSLSDVSEQIRIRSVYLAAIEDENWDAIGAPVYARGFLRTYARFLGLDPEEVVAYFNGSAVSGGSERQAGSADSSRGAKAGASRIVEERTGSGRISWMLWVAGLVAVLLVGFVIYNAVTFGNRRASSDDTEALATAAPSVLPSNTPEVVDGSGAPSASPLPGTLPGSTESLAVVLSAPSWLRVTVDGSVSMEGTFPAGTAKTFHGKNALIRIGNAGGVEVYVDGKDVGKLGKPGDVAERSFTL